MATDAGGPRVVVVGLGPAGAELITAGTMAELARVPVRFLRTSRHPAAEALAGAPSFDHHYKAAATFDEVYSAIVADLVDAARRHGEVLYAVPGSPRVMERTVELLAGEDRVSVRVVPAMSFLELAWVRLGVDPLEAGVRLVDGQRFAVAAAGQRGPLLVANCHNERVLSEIKLAYGEQAPPRVVVLSRLGLPEESVTELAWEDLDREVDPDHLTSLWVPETAPDVGGEMAAFHELVRTLRERCPWDREQTHASLSSHLLEESYEVLDALERLSAALAAGAGPGAIQAGYAALEEELGDLLFQVFFHSVLAAEAGAFDLAEVARAVHDKLRGRHPHVFGGPAPASLEALSADWERRKAREKGRESVMEGIPATLPALLFALAVQKRAAAAGVSWRELAEGVDLRGIGGRLMELVDEARAAGADPESELRAAAMAVRDGYLTRYPGVPGLPAGGGSAPPANG